MPRNAFSLEGGVRRFGIIACAAFTVAAAATMPAAAGIDLLDKASTAIDWQNCKGEDADNSIAGCTRIIEDSMVMPQGHAVAYRNRAEAWDAKGDRKRAIADYSDAIRLDPEDADSYVNRGLARHNSGDLDGGIADYTQAIRLNPNDSTPYNNRGNAWRQKGDLDRAVMDGTEAIRLDPGSALAYHSRGMTWRDIGDLNAAIADYTAAIDLDPKDALTYFNRGVALQTKGDLDRAVADYGEAIARDAVEERLDSKLVSAYRNRGYVQFLRKDFGLSAVDLAHAIAFGRNAYDVLYWYVARSRFGHHVVAELGRHAAGMDRETWPYPIIALFLGQRTPQELTAMPRNPGETCDVQFFVGQWHLLNGNKRDAGEYLHAATDACPENSIEHSSAATER